MTKVTSINVLVSMLVSFQTKLAKSTSSLMSTSKSLFLIAQSQNLIVEQLEDLDFQFWSYFPRCLPYYEKFLQEYGKVGKVCLSQSIQLLLKTLPQLSQTNLHITKYKTVPNYENNLVQSSSKIKKRRRKTLSITKQKFDKTLNLNSISKFDLREKVNRSRMRTVRNKNSLQTEQTNVGSPTSDFEFDSFLSKIAGFVLHSEHYDLAKCIIEIFIVDAIIVLLEKYEKSFEHNIYYEENLTKLNTDTTVLLREFAWSSFKQKKPL
ncbi:hypothetical protein M0813_19976 [Anaeramoeba flamelloides]|uniref:Uncharacterized protein n=1 Tax=Anaeramoeba flamelloides TaxID=1746091 RepID=A0ABQ8YLU0_9EUKA|nr:hypothetical protein M0813_19976 [Anaeramoeba flamelloides]